MLPLNLFLGWGIPHPKTLGQNRSPHLTKDSKSILVSCPPLQPGCRLVAEALLADVLWSESGPKG